jgi:hypothetical protein
MTGSGIAITPDYPRTAERTTEIGWAHGILRDGKPWMASLWEDDDGDRTLSLLFEAEEDVEMDEEAVLHRLIEEGLLELVAPEIEFYLCEQRDDLFSPTPLWMVEVLLSDAEREWARPGFTVQALSEYRLRWTLAGDWSRMLN